MGPRLEREPRDRDRSRSDEHGEPQEEIACPLCGEQDEEQRSFLQRKLQAMSGSSAQQTARFTCLAVDASAEVVCAGSEEPFEIYVWSVRTGRCLDVLAGHEGPISALAFSLPVAAGQRVVGPHAQAVGHLQRRQK